MAPNPHKAVDAGDQPALGVSDALSGRKIVIAYNPTAGASNRQQQVESLARRFMAAGFETTICADPAALVSAVAERAASNDLRGVVAAGGDGTVAMAVNQLPLGVPMAIFPLGTENLLSRYLEHSADVNHLLELFERGRIVQLDAATANGRLFCLMAGIGFDAEVVRRTHAARRGNITYLNYIKPILAALRNYSYPELQISILEPENMRTSLTSRWAFITNIPRYAGGLRFTPEALPHDGMLNACLFQRGGLWAGFTYLAGVLTGSHTRWRETTLRQGSVIRVESREPVPYQLDGDPGGELPLEIRCLPGRLRFLVSNAWLQRHRFPVSTGGL